jgi:hypothetical protein
MRRLFVGMVVAATTAVVPLWAMAGNQEVAEQIAANLRTSGELHGYKIGVRVQDGTAWLSGRVSSDAQLDAALELASKTEGVARVVNELTVSEGDSGSGSVQQVDGALGPEQVGQPISTDLTVPNNSGEPVETKTSTRLASAFAPPPVQSATVSGARPIQMPLAPQAGGRIVGMPLQPVPVAYMQQPMPAQTMGQPIPQYITPVGGGVAPARYDQPHLPSYSWPSYTAYPNYAGLTYPKQYSPTAWPYIGPFYPYPQVPLGWRKVVLEWHDGWWHLDFDDGGAKGGPISGLFRGPKKCRR